MNYYIEAHCRTASVHVDSCEIEEIESESVCVRHVNEGVYEVEDNGEEFRLRWQAQRDLCCVPSFSATMVNICKHPFSWTEICSSTKIASIDCDSVEQKKLCFSS